jgi:hypothetical protein
VSLLSLAAIAYFAMKEALPQSPNDDGKADA